MTARDDSFSPAQRRPREPGWIWPLVCVCQAFLYAAQLGILPFVMWGVYGDGNPTAHENQNAGRVTLAFGLVAAAAATGIGIAAWKAGRRALAITELILGVVITAAAVWMAVALMLTR